MISSADCCFEKYDAFKTHDRVNYFETHDRDNYFETHDRASLLELSDIDDFWINLDSKSTPYVDLDCIC